MSEPKSYVNEFACRLMEPEDVTVVGSGYRTHDGKRYRIIFARKKGERTGSGEQAYRYSDKVWDETDARAHCKAHKGKFSSTRASVQAYIDPLHNPLIPIEHEGIE